MKLAIIFNEKRFTGMLTNLFTGLPAYHCGWVDEEKGLFYDMHLIRRRRLWPRPDYKRVVLYDVPEVTREYLEHKLSTSEDRYGFLDYILFGIRPIYHLFGKSTRNAGGVICSEMCNQDMCVNGVFTPFDEFYGPPSPADLYRWFEYGKY